ncbi:conserved hypothetical protein [Sphingomonas sp. T1]|uniref:hypothetical protein n=1 Tax=Sphingomonas sp. T1 TaxID=2653172 RepID=UPI0012F04970|nr:hypothetical protein [Sphingomonas sp. T1]VXD07703.1 conserved hypothetical protein [Sphingomonas sp. T1]
MAVVLGFSLAAAAAKAVPVSTGFTWTTAAVGLLNLLVGGVLVAIIKSRPALKKIANEREANLLNERAEEMEAMRQRIAKLEEKAEFKEALHQAERAVDRHRINNLDQCLTAFLMMVKKNPDDAATAAAMIEEMRAQQIAREKQEAGAIHAAAIAATKPGAPE